MLGKEKGNIVLWQYVCFYKPFILSHIQCLVNCWCRGGRRLWTWVCFYLQSKTVHASACRKRPWMTRRSFKLLQLSSFAAQIFSHMLHLAVFPVTFPKCSHILAVFCILKLLRFAAEVLFKGEWRGCVSECVSSNRHMSGFSHVTQRSRRNGLEK